MRVEGVRPRVPPRDRRPAAGPSARAPAAGASGVRLLNKIKGVGYADYVEKTGETPPSLPLEGVSVGAATPIIYSPYGIGGGWRGFDNPFGRDIASDDATRLGVNIILYAMTH
jgi:hypothetical protein